MQPASVPGACPVVQVRASHLTRAHVIRLSANQGELWQGEAWRKSLSPARQVTARRVDIWHTWREVWGAYTDRASLEAEFGTLEGDLERLAEEAWDNRHRAMVIQLLIDEVSDACEIIEVFVILRLHDLIDAQPLPAAGMASEWGGGLSADLTSAELDLLVRSAGELWNSTGGHDPHDVLSRRQHHILDRAAGLYRADVDREMADAAEATR
jgi:hypothetical protein